MQSIIGNKINYPFFFKYLLNAKGREGYNYLHFTDESETYGGKVVFSRSHSYYICSLSLQNQM